MFPAVVLTGACKVIIFVEIGAVPEHVLPSITPLYTSNKDIDGINHMNIVNIRKLFKLFKKLLNIYILFIKYNSKIAN
jgi:hypothetical protein